VNVVFLILDAFSIKRLTPDLTPTLFKWASQPGAVATTGWSVMASCTYPNHATFATGKPPRSHGLFANHTVTEGRIVPSWEEGPSGETIFDILEGRHVEAVLGDHHLVGVMGAAAASLHWPDRGLLPLDVALDGLGYPHDDEVLIRLLAAMERTPELVIGYFGSIDTASHLYGPDSPEALEAYGQLDRRLAAIDEALRWEETVVLVASDHDQETALDLPGIDLRALAGQAGVEVIVSDEGSAALVAGTSDVRWLAGADGVAGWEPMADDALLVWADSGHHFGPWEQPILKGIHGGINTRSQLAMVTGGHPAVGRTARALGSRPDATVWAPLILDLLS
jgi:hypothetical protein